MKKFILFTFILFSCAKCFSQDLYRTFNGYVIISGEYNDSAFLAESHKLEFYYDGRSKNISGNINLKSLISGIPYLDSLIAVKSGNIITISGNFPVDFLTWDHKEYNLNVPVEIKFNDTTIKTVSKMKFTHTDKLTSYTCILETAFKLDLADFKVNVPVQLNSKVNVQFLQLILRRGDQ